MEYQKQLEVIRDLAKQLKVISAEPANNTRRQRWADHNELVRQSKPLLWVCPDDDGGWVELLGEDALVCEDEDLRELEVRLRRYLYHHEHFHDDFVFEPVLYFNIPGDYTGYMYGSKDQTHAWGIPVENRTSGQGAYALENYIQSAEDFETILQHEVDFLPNEKQWERLRLKYEEAVDGIIAIAFQLPYSVLVQSHLIELVHLRGLSNLLYDLYDQDELIEAVIRHMAESKTRLLLRMEEKHLLFDNRINIYTGSGSLGYTNSAPIPDKQVKLKDMWGFADAQEFSDVSPEMFERFAVVNQKKGLSLFGMACYGCCEPLDNKYDMIFKHLPNLRRVSVSPWSDVAEAAEKLSDHYIFSWKPNPARICCGFDEAVMRKELEKVKSLTTNCVLEIILKDIRTCDHTPEHMQKFVALVKEIF